MAIPTGLILEGLLAVLLVATICYCYVLDRKLRALRSGQDGMRELIDALHKATDLAQRSVGQLHDTSRTAADHLDERVKRAREVGDEVTGKIEAGNSKAKALADELSLMVESGNNLAERLEAQVAARTHSRQLPASLRVNRTAPAREETQHAAAPPALQNKLLEALRRAR
ncbi:DUF6468 domain-containing protein [Tepidicaulis sp.]|jgi:hypothetical protein|uniref:DUF6468 domain-containing protein n=1 Tax=Tepidicaulis sp. TaxID=1920809 RepID=UPI003B5B7269